jgi:hypothetical protein
MDFTEKFGLSKKDSRRLNTICKKIDRYQTLEKKMDYVDGLILWDEMDESVTDEQLDLIDDFLRSYV